jgi:hypothetical protein
VNQNHSVKSKPTDVGAGDLIMCTSQMRPGFGGIVSRFFGARRFAQPFWAARAVLKFALADG